MGLFNSLVLNYFIRNKVSANLTMNFVYELPIPKTTEKQKQLITEKGFELLYHKSNKIFYEDLRKELEAEGRSVDASSKPDLIETRAELEVMIARDLYKLTKEDWEYLTSTFIYGESETKVELDQIIERSKEIYK